MKERIILVHGTQFHSDDDDSFSFQAIGDTRTSTAWWQKHSFFRGFLTKQIQAGVEKSGDDREFEIDNWDWDGHNTESCRRDEGRRLLRHLRKLDREGQKYHIIAHSHGGSVVWHALTESMPFRELKGLQSATTVGTPYLMYRPRRSPLVYATMIGGAATAIAFLRTWGSTSGPKPCCIACPAPMSWPFSTSIRSCSRRATAPRTRRWRC